MVLLDQWKTIQRNLHGVAEQEEEEEAGAPLSAEAAIWSSWDNL